MAERYGYTDAWWAPTPYDSISSRLPWLKQHRVKAARFGVACPIPYEGYLADVIDPIVYVLAGNGITPYFVLNGWGGGEWAGMHAGTYGEHVGKYALRYGTNAVYCLWNEPNLCPAGAGPRSLTVAEAVSYNTSGAQIIKYVQPQATILGSPISPTNAHNIVPWREYLTAMYRDLPSYVECAMHLYPSNPDPARRVGAIEDQFKLGKSTGRPVHVTELDMAATWIFGDSNAPALAARAYDRLDALGARSIIYFSIKNHLPEAEAIQKAAS